MADALLRDLLRRFEANPEDPEVLGRLDEEFGRARRDLPWPVLVRCPRWLGLVDFAARFVAPVGPDDGLPATELDRVETRLRRRLPRTLREWYRLVGRRTDLLGGRHEPVAASELRLQDGVLVFYAEPEGLLRWGVLTEELGQDDPRVVTREDEGDTPLVWNPRISEFCWQMAVHQRMFNGGEWSAQAAVSPDEPRARLEAIYPRLPLPGWSMGMPEPDTIVHFGDRETILELDVCAPIVTVLATSGAALARARSALQRLEPGWYD